MFERNGKTEFCSLVQELSAPGEIRQIARYDYEFKNVEKQFESYTGVNIKLRYYLKVTVVRRLSDIVREKNIWVHSYKMPADISSNLRMEVGIEDCLHIEFEYNKSKYSLKDLVVGKIYFILIRVKIKLMELSIVRRESIGSGGSQFSDNETVAKHEIMDGAPGRKSKRK